MAADLDPVSADAGTTGRPAPTGRGGRVLVTITFVPAALLALLAVGGLVAGLGVLSQAGSYVLPTLGPRLVVVSVALAGGVFALRRRARRRALVTIGLALLAGVLTAAQVVTFVVAVHRAGGSADVFRALALGSADGGSPGRSQTFTAADGRRLNAVVYAPPESAGRAPVLVYVHGGGWIIGSERDESAALRWFADRGWLVVSLEYPLATAERHTWETAPADVACGLAWVAENAVRFGGDPAEPALAGDSAGGNLAVNVGYAAAAHRAPGRCGPRVPTPGAVVVQYPVVDPRSAWAHNARVPGFSPRDFTRDYVGGGPEQYPARFDAVSSATYLSAEAPPTLIVSPDRDGLIPPSGVRAFAARARAAGVDVTLVRLPFANHNYDALAARSLGDQARRSLTLAFLRAHPVR